MRGFVEVFSSQDVFVLALRVPLHLMTLSQGRLIAASSMVAGCELSTDVTTGEKTRKEGLQFKDWRMCFFWKIVVAVLKSARCSKHFGASFEKSLPTGLLIDRCSKIIQTSRNSLVDPVNFLEVATCG